MLFFVFFLTTTMKVVKVGMITLNSKSKLFQRSMIAWFLKALEEPAAA